MAAFVAGGAFALGGERTRLSFRAVNRRDTPGYDPAVQRHHLIPRQLGEMRCFAPMIAAVGRERIGFEDFRRNGLLLPSREDAALRMALPLHRGPHRDYSALVRERFGQIEIAWAALRPRAPEVALDQAAMRLALLQRALRRRLLADGPGGGRVRMRLNRHDPLGHGADFGELDALVDALWGATAPAS